MTMDHVGKDVAGDDAAANGQDLEQPCRDQERAADHVSRGLAIGHLVRELLVEGAAAFLVVFWSGVAALMQEMYHTLTFPMVCLVVALTVAFVLAWLGPAHFNPAVTVTFTVFRYFPWTKLPLYVMVQLGGSVLACLSVNGVMKPREEHFYGTVPMAGHTRLPFLLEFLGSAVLMVVIATVSRGSVNHKVAGLAIGATVGTLGLIIGPVSGGSMNPVRTLGPAIVLGRYTSVWIYLVAPVSGMLLGALCNRAVRRSDSTLAFLCGGEFEAVAPRTRSALTLTLTPRAAGAAVASQNY
ncbi:aquaporin NIP4-1-like [Phragmites australis]|uniref:aquaporin NIP4-1-like n=1 Tax=Phragmites australis TaxID=29695 RepID=UPI002D766407|nr:aquaporin NIP4-1-like [Phragmites australis]